MLSFVLFIIILGTIVLIHELGHFLFSKLFGVYVYEYSIGMGKKIFSKKPPIITVIKTYSTFFLSCISLKSVKIMAIFVIRIIIPHIQI